MSRIASVFAAALVFGVGLVAHADPIRIFIRAGVKTHGPEQHDHPHFLKDYTQLLRERGAVVDGALGWPTAAQFDATDVVVVYAQDPWDVSAEQRANIDAFAKRGGGFVVIHDGLCGAKDPAWVKSVIGGAWTNGKAKWFEGDMSLYYVNNENPITTGASNFDLDDELYYDLDLDPTIRVLASTWTPDQRGLKNGRAFPHVYNSAPQMWTYETDWNRAFVSIPGHNWKTFEQPQYRAVLLRGIAWAGKRDNINELCSQDELGSLRYPVGGPSTPIEELAKLAIHPDFKTNLIAAEPVINKPIALDWDPQGRLWVAETPEYPNGRRGMKPEYAGAEWKDHGSLVEEAGKQNRPAHDKISILVDSNHDGIADTKQVFYEGLDLVTGFVFYKDGVIVTQAPDILWVRDTKGTGKADKVEVLYHGLGTFDTHAVINNPRWGLDGWIYATHGYSGSKDVTNGDGTKHFGSIGSGVIRFKPDGSAIEQYSSKGGNTWGLAVTWDDEIMWTQPTSGDLLMQTLLPESVLARGKYDDTPSYKIVKPSDSTFPLMTWEQQAYRQIDWVGHFTAAAGCAIYDGGTWPAEWNGSYFTTEPTINIVHHSFVTPDGISYTTHKEKGREQTEFIVSRDMWFRPIETRIGPDGALYVVDFYNQAVIHNDTRGPAHNNVNAAVRPDRDHYFARIWRLNHRQAEALPVQDLSHADASGLVAALSSPNQPVRMTAARLLAERNEGAEELTKVAGDVTKPAPARVQALWLLQREGKLDDALLLQAASDQNDAVARNALKIDVVRSGAGRGDSSTAAGWYQTLVSRVADPNLANELNGVLALGIRDFHDSSTSNGVGTLLGWRAEALLAAKYVESSDHYIKSAVLAAVEAKPLEYLRTAEHLGESEAADDFISRVTAKIAEKQDPALAAKVVSELAESDRGPVVAIPPHFHTLILEKLSAILLPARTSEWTPALQADFQRLLKTEAAPAALPLLHAWDKQNALGDAVKAVVENELATLADSTAPENRRTTAAGSLIGLRHTSPAIQAALTEQLGSKAPAALQKAIIEGLARENDEASGALLIEVYPKLDSALQGADFAEILKRKEWTSQFVAALSAGKVKLQSLGTIGLDKLRHYPDPAIASAASQTIASILGPLIQQKDEVIAKMLPIVQGGGDIAKGKLLFDGTCAICHKLNGHGGTLAPDLTGIGAHPRLELLVDIVDPNREVDPSFAAFDFTMKNGDLAQGIISRENAESILVRDAGGDHELKKREIARRSEVGRSLMPEGFEGLGAETLRDVIAYLQSTDSKYRIIDLRAGCDADSRHTLFTENTGEPALKFKRFGAVRVGDVPFLIRDPGAIGSDRNLIVLKGGEGLAQTYPQKVEIPVGHIEANALNFLGGVGGWAFPCCGDEKGEGLPAAKVTVYYEGGQSDELILKNGVEFADYVRPHDVPESKSAADLVDGQQVRVFRKVLSKGGVIEKIVLESYNNRIAPIFVGITAEKVLSPAPASAAPAAAAPGTPAAAPTSPATPAASTSKPTSAEVAPDLHDVRILIVGGGSSHDFKRWYGEADQATIEQLHPAWLSYTENPSTIPQALASLDLLALSTNQPISSEARQGIMSMAAAGKGLVLLHPGVWYNWNNFPEYNRDLVGGGARGHDRYGEFEVQVTNPAHPIMAGLPDKFKVHDELYHFTPDPNGAPIEVLAKAVSPLTGETFPQVWTVKHPSARIVCITLGHDGGAHDLPEYQRLLQNALRWAARK